MNFPSPISPVSRRVPMMGLLLGIAVAATGCTLGSAAGGGSSAPTAASTGAAGVSGQPAAGTSSAAASDVACRLVTNSDVAAAAGYPIVKSSEVNSDVLGTDQCTFQGAQDSNVFYITIYNTPASQQLPLQLEPISEPVAGLGDSAFWAQTAGFFVRKGGRILGLQDPGMSAGKDALAALAAKAVPHL